MVTFSLLVTRIPSPPVPAPWSLKAQDRPIRPLAADGHAADVERERGAAVEPPRAQLDDLAGPGVDQGRLDPLRGHPAPGSIRVTLAPSPRRADPRRDEIPSPAGRSAQPATNTAAQHKAAATMSTTRTSGLPAEVPTPGPAGTPGQRTGPEPAPDIDSMPTRRQTPTHPGR